jgi:hypothetical protein
MKEKVYVCGYTHCLHINEKVKEEDSVIIGNKHLHKECAEIKSKIDTLKDLYYDEIDKNVKFVELVGVLNNIVFKKGVSPDYMIFALKYSIDKRIRIKSPYSLHYLVTNKVITQLWKKESGVK